MVDHSAPTQARFPWRTVVRTMFQIVTGWAPVVPLVLEAVYQRDPATLGGAAAVALTLSTAITRVMAVPKVNELLASSGLLAWLAAEPKD